MFQFTEAQLKVISAVSANFVVVWLVAMLGTADVLALTINLILAIVSWYLAIKAEETLKKYD